MANKNQDEKFAYLGQLSTEQLEELIRADVESPEIQNAEAIFHILEVLNERAKQDPEGISFEKERVWNDIQTMYHIPEGKGRSLYPVDGEEDDEECSEETGTVRCDARPTVKKRTPFRTWLSIAAAAVILVFGSMVGAQATGIDVFGFLARWTADVFRFAPASGEYDPAIQEAFVQNHFPRELALQWYPEGFEASEPKVVEEDFSTAIIVRFHNSKEDTSFVFEARRYASAAKVAELGLQWEAVAGQTHTHGGKTFVITPNEDRMTATWSDREKYVVTISGDLSREETEKIIDSIGG